MRPIVLQVFILYLTATEEAIAGCFSPLGLASGSIKDSQVSASTVMSEWLLPSAGRLHNTMSSSSFGAWCAGDIDTDQWLQIDLLTTTNVSAVASQGVEIMGDGGHWVTQYSLNYSCDGVKWFQHRFQGADVVFKANNDSNGVVTNGLAIPTLARFIRVKPLAWNLLGTICLRLELYGCQTSRVCPHPTQDPTSVVTTKATTQSTPLTKAPTTTRSQSKSSTLSSGQKSNSPFTDSAVGTTNTTSIACSDPLGMQSGAINDSQIKGSSFKSTWTRPSEGRLHNQWSVHKMSLGGWCADDSDKNPYLQVDLINNTMITALATQGLPGNGNLALRYKLNYSCDGQVWFEYQQGKIFDGYRNNRRVRWNKLPVPLEARLVRIRPLLSDHDDKACVRLEIYGCKKANVVCGNKRLSNATVRPDQYSQQVPGISATPQGSITEIARRPTRQKDMIVIVRAQDQRPQANNSAEYNATRKTYIFLAFIIVLLNCL